MAKPKPLPPPVAQFTSAKGRVFTVDPGEREKTVWGDADEWPILFDGKPAGKLFLGMNYSRPGEPRRWQASTRELYWRHAGDAPTGIGFDVAAFDTAEECLQAWGRSADQILDWSEGEVVVDMYGREQRRVGT